METFLFCLVVSWLCVRGSVEDTIYAAKGKTSPRQAYRQKYGPSGAARVGRATASRLADRIENPRGPGPMRRYFHELWEDSLTSATENRRQRAERKHREAQGLTGDVPETPDGQDGGKERHRWYQWHRPTPKPEPEPGQATEPSPVHATAERLDTELDAHWPTVDADTDLDHTRFGPEAESQCPKCPGVIKPYEGANVSYDEGDGSAMVDTRCDRGCGISSAHYWRLTDEEYRREFGHDFDEDPEERFSHGMRVRHPHFGTGTVHIADPDDPNEDRIREVRWDDSIVADELDGVFGQLEILDDDPPGPGATAPAPTEPTPDIEEGVPASPDTDHDHGSVSLIRPLPEGAPQMSTPTAGEGSLADYIRYAQDMQQAATDMVASLETTAAGLATQEYGEDVTNPLQQAMEHANQIQALLAQAETKLHESEGVQEAYMAAMHTGSKESLLAG
jgi:hypothetical protein